VPYSGNVSRDGPIGAALAQERAKSKMHDPMMIESQGFEQLPVGGGWLVDESLFRLLVNFEIHKAQRLRYSVSVVCFAVEPVLAGNGEASLSSVAESITRYLRRTDAVASWAEGWVSLLLVDAETTHLPLILQRLTTRLETVAWSAGGSCYPRTAIQAEDMLRQAVDLMGRARQEGGNRLYVAS
jgi:hypothetical protein